ncbi:MAG: hypothetical protein IT318_19925 [Anaerolineales bacterium]|nr:hypothetical protein [Anaerolineales bacterium]
MTAWRSFYHLVRADFLERTRGYGFLIVLGLTVWAGYLFVPPAGASYAAMALGDYRGVYNSAWVGTMVAIMTSLFLTLAGFYLVKDAVERDERTGVGQILAATPLSKLLYVLGKALSNFAVLAAMAAVLAVAALAMQLIRAEDARVDLWALGSPFVLIVLPPLAMVAALAVLFETVRFLRGGFGNISYFFLWIAVIVAGAILPSQGESGPRPVNDLLGINIPLAQMTAAAKAAYPAYDGAVTVGISAVETGALAMQTFEWAGMAWTPAQAAGRLLWVGAAVGVALLAAVFFNRFDGSRARPAAQPAAAAGRSHGGSRVADGGLLAEGAGGSPSPRPSPAGRGCPEAGGRAVAAASGPHEPATFGLSLAPLPPARFSLLALTRAELRLLLKGQRWWWHAGALGLIIAGLVATPETARQIILPLAWVWPVLIWSGLGSREARHATGAMVFSAPRPVARQLPAAWLAGVAVALTAGSGVLLTLARTGDAAGLLAWATGALFIPALALALGVLSGGSKLFEVLYTAWWYSGPLNGVAGLDFMGARHGGLWPAYLALAAGLLGLAVLGRWRQARHGA